MVKVHKIMILSLLLLASFLVSAGLSQATFAETDPNGNIITTERDISLSPERLQEKKDEEQEDDLIKVATTIVVIIAVSAVLYFNKGKVFKQHKRSRKK